MKKYISYFLPASLTAAIVFLSYVKIAHHNELWRNAAFNGDIAVIVLYLLWMIYETAISHHDVTQKKSVFDYGTKQFYGASHALTILSALWFTPIWQKPGIYLWVGLIIFVSGVYLRVLAIRTLGQYYSHTVRKIENHKIVDTGPYRYLRHPAYSGMLVAHIGITIFFFNYITAAIFVFLLIPSIILRIMIEEKMLMTIRGYADFAETRKRIIPFIW